MSIYALILAGGRGSRLGDVRKGALRIGGQTLFDRVAERLPDLPLLVSTGPDATTGFDRGTTLPDDTSTFEGPMAGIMAAIRHLGDADANDMLLTVAVDTPFLPHDFPARMSAALAGNAASAYAAWGDQIYPTNAIYRLDALFPLLSHPAPNSPKRLLQSLNAEIVDWTGQAEADPFANLNALADLITLGHRARATDK